jgi:hypothetical protein
MNDLLLIHVRYQAMNMKMEEVVIIGEGEFLLDYTIRRRIQIRTGVDCTFYFIRRYGSISLSGREYHQEWNGPKSIKEELSDGEG